MLPTMDLMMLACASIVSNSILEMGILEVLHGNDDRTVVAVHV